MLRRFLLLYHNLTKNCIFISTVNYSAQGGLARAGFSFKPMRLKLTCALGGDDMFDYIFERVKREGEYIIETNSTVRAAAAHFGISKSTVHKDVSERLAFIDKAMYKEVRLVLSKNLSERHIRGGLATKSKYEKIRHKQ
jgi:putative DeoR family transcriptional regulator (stage III sporulation protein D)